MENPPPSLLAQLGISMESGEHPDGLLLLNAAERFRAGDYSGCQRRLDEFSDKAPQDVRDSALRMTSAMGHDRVALIFAGVSLLFFLSVTLLAY